MNFSKQATSFSPTVCGLAEARLAMACLLVSSALLRMAVDFFCTPSWEEEEEEGG
jgi:hypothetical protein